MQDEAVVLSMATGKYYGLNPVGVSIWKSIQAPAALDEIESVVMSEYEIDQETCHREVLTFLKQMADEKLIEILDEKTS